MVEYASDSIGFRWAGCEEGDQAEDEGTAELLDDGTNEIEFANHDGDEAVLKAKRATVRKVRQGSLLRTFGSTKRTNCVSSDVRWLTKAFAGPL